MDELLSLFDDNTAEETALTSSVKSGEVPASLSNKKDDFASAFGKKKSTSNNNQVNRSLSNTLPATNKAPATCKPSKYNQQVACDPITGFRITDRKTSRAEMVDHFALLTYKSVNMIAAFSRSEWTTYTTDGSDKGSTNLATCGIITADTSSRVSSNTGRAFAMIQLGDLSSPTSSGVVPSKSNNNNIHALVTVFLFGDALGVIKRNKRYLQKGWVVSILNPSLMPSRDGSSTAVSLSVNDPKQILLIGRSVDCGNCKGTIRKKVASDYGSKWEDVGCSTLIDLRSGSSYCLTHRRQGLSSRGSTNNTNKAPESRLQKMRADNVKNGVSSAFNNQRNVVSSQGATQGGRTSSLSLSEALSRPGILEEATLSGTSSTMTTQHLKKAPKHMKKAASTNSAKVTNPYATSKTTEKCKKRQDPGVSQGDVLGEALARKRMRLGDLSSSKKISMQAKVKPKCKVFQAEGFDGSVQVPKPNSLFRKAVFSQPVGSSSLANTKPATTDILEKQRSLAKLLKQKKDGSVNTKTEDLLSRLSSRRVQPSSNTGQSSFAASFGDNNSLDRDSLLGAQSRFASAASVQEYARARGAVQELEAKEFESNQRKQRTGNNKNGAKASDAPSKETNIVTAGWICRSCKKKTPFKPVGCIRARHDVQQQRELKNRVSSIGSTKERLQRHGKDSDEGGLTLGSGIEWSSYRRGYL